MDRIDSRVGCGILWVCVLLLIVVSWVVVLAWLTSHVGLLHAPLPEIRQIVDTPVPGAYKIPPTPVHDVYAVDVVWGDGVQSELIEVEVPWSTHSTEAQGWYRVPLTVILPGALP